MTDKYNTTNAPPPHISTRLPYIKTYQSSGHKIDPKLLNECAYYPREGCQYCRWDWPYPKCERAEILVKTRCAGVTGWRFTGVREGKRVKGGKVSRKERFWNDLPKELQDELRQIIERG